MGKEESGAENTYHYRTSSCTTRHRSRRPAPADCDGGADGGGGGASGRRGTFVQRTARTGRGRGEGTRVRSGGEQAV